MTIVITRPASRTRSLAAALNQAGANVLFAPAIEIAPPSSYAALDACLARVESYAWLVFTSPAAIEAVALRLSTGSSELHADFSEVRIAAVGATTAAAAARLLGRVDHIGGGDADTLATTLPMQAGDRILFVCSDRARDVLPGILAKRGALLDRAVGYRTISVDCDLYAESYRQFACDLVIVCSPSSAEVLAKVASMDGVRIPPVICIGGTTASVAKSSGLQVVGIASRPSEMALLETVTRAVWLHRCATETATEIATETAP